MAEQFLTVEQAADRLHVHPITIRRHLRSGILRGVKLGHLWRVPESALSDMAQPAAPAHTDTPVESSGESPNDSPLWRALAMIKELENEMSDAPKRILGVNDVATEIRQMREERTP